MKIVIQNEIQPTAFDPRKMKPRQLALRYDGELLFMTEDLGLLNLTTGCRAIVSDDGVCQQKYSYFLGLAEISNED